MQTPNLFLEQQWPKAIIAGVDEAGRGSLAGPVVAAAVIIQQDHLITGINDSKKLSRATRESLYNQIIHHYSWAVGIVSAAEIDQTNILIATKKACILAVANLSILADIVLIDGNMKFTDARYRSIINGDNLSLSIAAASIIAKVTRDHLMFELDQQFPQYLWHRNVGYGTKQHINAIKQYGLSSYHRKSFKLKSGI
ncbi:ribonuclease HII [Candidatus Trichorickettsia mobilis]|uniref:ribonuclease HII n=1 Tax=Candidatus Trichorickettsia mobilis TaxID=1346319 RepID=UPI00292E784D|nr:ribonuclease HII [Candidatus Trichorickettsia mobilis]